MEQADAADFAAYLGLPTAGRGPTCAATARGDFRKGHAAFTMRGGAAKLLITHSVIGLYSPLAAGLARRAGQGGQAGGVVHLSARFIRVSKQPFAVYK